MDSFNTSRWIRLAVVIVVGGASACSTDPDVESDAAHDASDDTAADGGSGDADAGSGGDAEDDGTADGSGEEPDWGCFDDLAIGEAEVFFDGFTAGSEGIAFGPDGKLYVTSGGRLWRFDADGTRTDFAGVHRGLGVAPVADGVLVAGAGDSAVGSILDGSLFFVGTDGVVETVVDGLPTPNFVTVMPDGSALVSDDFVTNVWRVTRDGVVSDVLTDIASPNGMGYSPDGRYLYVVSTFTSRGEITRFSVGPDGLPDGIERVEIAEMGDGSTPDGMAVDALGRVYVAANIQNRIARMNPDGSDVVDIATGLSTPASLAFGNGEGFDPCSLYVTSLFGSTILRVNVGVSGAPLNLGP